MKTYAALSLIAAIAILLYLPQTAQAQLTILHSFGDGSVANDGNNPSSALVVGPGGYFYGTTYYGGSSGYGAVYKMDSTGNVTILHSFGDGSVANDGAYPDAELVVGTDGNLYGTCEYGGSAASCGTAFKITPSGAETVLHVFDYNDGSTVQAGLVQGPDGYFYGDTFGGGTGQGTIYKVDSNSDFTTLATLGTSGGNSPRGTLLLAPDGNFYGVCTAYGIDTVNSSGTIFRVSPTGAYTDIYIFGKTTNSGEYPIASVAPDTSGNLWGTTYYGGIGNFGTIYSMNTLGSKATFYSFAGSSSNDGANPAAGLCLASNGIFYGTTSHGGIVNDDNGEGTLFDTTTPLSVSSEGDLHKFFDGSVANDGLVPTAGVIQAQDGDLYGTTVFGGSTILDYNPGLGTAFRYVIDNSVGHPPPLRPFIDRYIEGPVYVQPGVPVECIPVFGSQFCSGARVLVSGQTELQTAFLGPTELLAFIPTSLMSGASIILSVILPGVGSQPGAQSNTVTFKTHNPAPGLTGFGPSSVIAGKQATVTVHGKNLLQNSTVLWDGAAAPTLWISNTELKSSVTPAPESTGFAQISVASPAPGGGTTHTLDVPVVPTSLDVLIDSLDRSPASGLIDVNLTVENVGPGTAQSVQINSSTLGGVGTVTTLPVALGTISSDGSVNATVSFPGSVGIKGAKVKLVVSGTFVGPANGTCSLTKTVKLP